MIVRENPARLLREILLGDQPLRADTGAVIAPSEAKSGAPSMLTVRAAAKVLAVSDRTLWTLTDRGEIPAVRIGRSVRYDPRDLTRWIEKSKPAAE